MAYVAHDRCVSSHSIELDQYLYEQAKYRFRNWPNIRLYQGDSGEVLPRIVSQLSGPGLFWLDGHYSGGETAKGSVDTPISTELQVIFDTRIRGHVVLIDDVRCFDGTNDYPFLDDLLATVRRNGEYRIEVSADIIRLTPESIE